MATKSAKAPQEAVERLSRQEHEATLQGPPELVCRLIRIAYGALEARNPLIKPQINRIKRRILALDRLEFRAIRAALWEESRDRTLDEMRERIEAFNEDPTLLIGRADGHLTWIENATAAQIAEQARKLPEAIVRMEQVADLAFHRATAARSHAACGHDGEHSHLLAQGQPLDLEQIRRLMITALCDTIACREPDLAPRVERAKQRLLALSPVRMRALRATIWQAKHDKPVSTILTKLEGWFERPAERLDHMEQRLDAVEGLSSRAVEEQAALLPRTFVALEEEITQRMAMA